MSAVIARQRYAVASGALPAVREGRRIEMSGLPAVARVAILAEAAGALAALARRQAHLSHVDSRTIARLVTDPADAYAVLGRGRWLPMMQRSVLAVPARNIRRRIGSAAPVPIQPSLFSTERR